MLNEYTRHWTAHVKRGTREGFFPLSFAQFVSLAKHLEAINASEKSK